MPVLESELETELNNTLMKERWGEGCPYWSLGFFVLLFCWSPWMNLANTESFHTCLLSIFSLSPFLLVCYSVLYYYILQCYKRMKKKIRRETLLFVWSKKKNTIMGWKRMWHMALPQLLETYHRFRNFIFLVILFSLRTVGTDKICIIWPGMYS